MIRETLQIGDLRLKAENKTVVDFSDPAVRQVITDLVDTMHENGLVGMAAPQIGENWRIFVTEPRETETRPADQTDILRVYINQEIISSSSDVCTIYEGCGCVANATIFGPVERPKTITIRAYDQDGKLFELTADGLLGRVVQHENDHMNGIEFTEKITDYRKLMDVKHYIERIKNSPEQKQASLITTKVFKYV